VALRIALLTLGLLASGGVLARAHGSPEAVVEVVRAFVADGITPRSALVPDGQGNLYGTTTYGGLYGQGNVFKIDATGAMTIVHSFSGGDDGRNPNALIRAGDGSFWGTTQFGGGRGPGGDRQGIVFRIDPAGTFSVIYRFDPFDAATWGIGQPNAIVDGGDGWMYGTAAGSGAVFKVNAAGVLTAILVENLPENPGAPNPGLILARDGSFFYGTTRYGGPTGCGTIFRMTSALGVTIAHNFDCSVGGPAGGLVEGDAGWFYGATAPFAFKFQGAGPPIPIHTFDFATEGDTPKGALLRASDGFFYGATTSGGPFGSTWGPGPNGSGTVFRMNAAGSVAVLHAFPGCCSTDGSDGNEVVAPLAQGDDGYIYGAASDGGFNRSGLLFRIAPAGGYELFYRFANEPFQPRAPLVESLGSLWGTTFGGGYYQRGTVFGLDDTRALSILLSTGNRPSGDLVPGQGGKFHGALGSALAGQFEDRWGSNNLFEIETQTDAGGVIILKTLALRDNGLSLNPYQIPTYLTLMQAADGTFYGTSNGSVYGAIAYGTVFTLDSGFNVGPVLHAFDPPQDGGYPLASLIQGSDGYLYGTNSALRPDNAPYPPPGHENGTVFRMDPATGAVSLLHSFNGADGAHPMGPLCQPAGIRSCSTLPSSDQAFYGTTADGGIHGLGTVFRIDGAGFLSLHSFGGADGANPQGGLILASDGYFYGTTRAGGASDDGTVFRMDPGGNVTVLRSFTRATDGASPFAGLFEASDGYLYGTNSEGGPRGDGGTLFRLHLPLEVSVVSPNGGEKLYTGTPYHIDWTASGGAGGITSFDVSVSTNGVTYSAVPGCTGVSGALRSCTWTAPGPASATLRIKVTAHDAGGAAASDTSNAVFAVASGAAAITLKAPNTATTNWGIGTTQQIKWSHNIGAGSFVKIELARDGVNYGETIAAKVKNTTAAAGSFNWLVTGPATTKARVRVTWTNATTSDISNAGFTIAPIFVKVVQPNKSTVSWGYGTTQKQAWTSNLGVNDRVDVLLSTDGGATYATTLATGVLASKKNAAVTAPTLGAPITTARVKVVWSNPPAGLAAGDDNPANFKIEPPFVRVTFPNGGQILAVGSTQTITWAHNLGTQEKVSIALSKDGGATYPISVLANTSSDGKQAVIVQSGWVSPTVRVKVTWTENADVADASDANLAIQ
jgi:uncharacterized repeat protein (TIGR03803 family)